MTRAFPSRPEELAGLRGAAQAYREAMELQFRNIHSAGSKLSEALGRFESKAAELATGISNEQGRLDGITAAFQTQFNEAQELRSRGFADELRMSVEERDGEREARRLFVDQPPGKGGSNPEVDFKGQKRSNQTHRRRIRRPSSFAKGTGSPRSFATSVTC